MATKHSTKPADYNSYGARLGRFVMDTMRQRRMIASDFPDIHPSTLARIRNGKHGDVGHTLRLKLARALDMTPIQMAQLIEEKYPVIQSAPPKERVIKNNGRGSSDLADAVSAHLDVSTLQGAPSDALNDLVERIIATLLRWQAAHAYREAEGVAEGSSGRAGRYRSHG